MAITAKKSLRLFILGATGGIGRELVDQTLHWQHRVTAFLRSPQKLGAPREGLTMIQGDVLNAEAVAAALAGHDAVLSAIGPPGPGRTTITGDSAQATLAAMRATGVRRLLIVGVAVLFDDAGILARLLRKTLLRNVANDSAEMERIVRASNLDWTIRTPAASDERPADRALRYRRRSPAVRCGWGGNDKPSRCRSLPPR